MRCMRRGPSEVRLSPIMPRQRCCGCRGARKQDHAAARSVDRVEAGKVSRCRGEPVICLPCQCGRAVRCARSAPDLSSGAAPRHSRASHQPRTCTEWGGKGGLGLTLDKIIHAAAHGPARTRAGLAVTRNLRGARLAPQVVPSRAHSSCQPEQDQREPASNRDQ